MYFVYSCLLTLGFLILSPRFLLDALRHGKYVEGFRERMGLYPPLENSRPVIWLHCVSVGESQAARPLAKALKESFPDHQLVISTITVTGQRLAREVFKDIATRVIYFPFDWGFTVSRALKRINPALVLLMETEIWPGFLRQSAEANIPVVLVNGRISERSFRRYRLVKPFISGVLNSLRLAVMQTEADARRVVALGLSSEKVRISGSLKFDAGVISGKPTVTEELRRFVAVNDRPLIVAASTHQPEERILLEAFKIIYSDTQPKPRLLIAPRHPERFNEVASLMSSSGFAWSRRSAPTHSGKDVDLFLLDTIGELPAAYPLATVVFVGGSLVKHGGHNILEPAAIGSCIVTGAHTHNFAAIVHTFVEAEGIIQLPPLDEADAHSDVADGLRALLSDTNQQKDLKERAKALVEKNLGATSRTLDYLSPILNGRSA